MVLEFTPSFHKEQIMHNKKTRFVWYNYVHLTVPEHICTFEEIVYALR